MKEVFFGELTFTGWDQLLIKLAIWVFTVALVLWLLRLIINKFRIPELNYKDEKFYMVRDLFLHITAIECLVAFTFVYTVYAGFWEWIVRLENYDWNILDTFLAASPQILTYLIIIIVFFVKLYKFRQPFK